MQKLLSKGKRVSFADRAEVQTYDEARGPITVTYDSGADGNYLSESDRRKARLPILRKSTRRGAWQMAQCAMENTSRNSLFQH